ncbi:YwhD family protein, partial [Bacillus cereus]|uniref:YwhD family protein n=1 Tax=Bacillus cereus TaxID=1396 RepID=UPI0037BE64AE
MGFNILKNHSTHPHPAFRLPPLTLQNISPLFLHLLQKTPFVHIPPIHPRTTVQKPINFLTNKEQVPNPKPFCLLSLTI